MQLLLPAEPLLDTIRMRHVLRGWADSRGKIARMLETGELVALRRGLYATRRELDPRCLAGPIYGPSYVSFETALAWHGSVGTEENRRNAAHTAWRNLEKQQIC